MIYGGFQWPRDFEKFRQVHWEFLLAIFFKHNISKVEPPSVGCDYYSSILLVLGFMTLVSYSTLMRASNDARLLGVLQSWSLYCHFAASWDISPCGSESELSYLNAGERKLGLGE